MGSQRHKTYHTDWARFTLDPYPVLAVVWQEVLAPVLVETTTGGAHLR